MMNVGFISKDSLKIIAAKYGVELDEKALDRFDCYAKLLAEWNEKINLTAITDPQGITVKHFADSLAVLGFVDIPSGAKLIDVGTGAGFPGAALLIARPDLKLTLLDSTAKKLNVVANILDKLGLDAEILHSRAEEAGKSAKYREKFDFATARAVAELRTLSEYCLPFVKTGGSFISMKGSRTDEEIADAEKAISILGGKIDSVNRFVLEDAGERSIIITKKVRQTPTKYPRQSGKIAKSPLG